jgi:hypothetical protein
MATKELKAALRQITAVLTDPRVNPGQRDRLLKARRELENIARSGKGDQRRFGRTIQLIAVVLLEIVTTEVAPRRG